MMKFSQSSRALSARLRGGFSRLATGGDWAITQSANTRRNLIWFWLDGFFASASDNIVGPYLVVYLLALGATQGQIGLMSSLSSFSAALLLLPGAMLVERLGRRRNIVLVGGGWSRLALFFLALLPLVVKSPVLVYLAIGLSISRDALGNLSYPAWMSMTGDIVPIEGRGRYFSSRNFIMGVSGIAMTLLAGVVISRMSQPTGYQVALLAAFAIGSLSIYSFAHLGDRSLRPAASAVAQPVPEEGEVPARKPSFLDQLREVFSYREFAFFAATTVLWNFSLNVAGPFFSVYLVKNLHADATMIGLTTVASTVASMLAQRKLGELNDRWGARRLTMISGLLIPIVPLAWAFINSAWYVIPINLVSGALWAGYSLASFNYLLSIVPPERVARFSAFFQITVTISLAVGAAVGSVVVTHAGYQAVFVASAVGRMAAALLFVWLIRRRASTPRPVTA